MTESKPTMGSVAGQISGIMSGIFSSAQSALALGPKTSTSAKMEAAFYRETLERILRQSTRAEEVWREYMDSL
jgi:hypothetical protein